MNKHFKDAKYYLKRAGEHASEGVKDELSPVQERVRSLVGKETEPDPSRVERIRADLEELQQKAEGETKSAIEDAREKLETYRKSSD